VNKQTTGLMDSNEPIIPIQNRKMNRDRLSWRTALNISGERHGRNRKASPGLSQQTGEPMRSNVDFDGADRISGTTDFSYFLVLNHCGQTGDVSGIVDASVWSALEFQP